MIDPKKASENLRRDQFRVDVLGLLIAIANAPDIKSRYELDERIWQILGTHGAIRSASDAQACNNFCQHGTNLGNYTALIESKLSSISDISAAP